MKKIKVALVGTGNWSLQHCRILKQHPQVEFCGILGRNKERTKKRAKLYNVPYYIDLKDLIKYQLPLKYKFISTSFFLSPQIMQSITSDAFGGSEQLIYWNTGLRFSIN